MTGAACTVPYYSVQNDIPNPRIKNPSPRTINYEQPWLNFKLVEGSIFCASS
jgi:hypothetical protein